MKLDCGFEKENNWFRYRAGAIIINDDKMLFVKSAIGDYYYMIGGGVHLGETSPNCIEREVLEETGINIEIIPGFVKSSEYSIQGKIEKSVSIFLAKTEQTDYKLQEEEIEECGWYGFDAALKVLNYENDKYILTEAERFISENTTQGV